MINPSPEKGLMFVARLAEEIGLQRPDLAMLFIESRGSAGRLVGAGLTAGFDLRRHENLMLSTPVAQPREIYAATRVLLVPSLWNEPAGRVAAEALFNGIPPLVSDRGGLPEICNGAGFVLPIPAAITPRDVRPVDAAAVQPWIDLIARLEDDEEFYLRRPSCAPGGRNLSPGPAHSALRRLLPIRSRRFMTAVGVVLEVQVVWPFVAV